MRMEKELENARENGELQKQILEELSKLKESPLKGIDTMDNDALREERDRLLDENAKMRVNTPTAGKEGDASTVRYLRSKVCFYSCSLKFSLNLDLPLRENSGTTRKRAVSVDCESNHG